MISIRSFFMYSILAIGLLLQSCASTEIPRSFYNSVGKTLEKYNADPESRAVIKAHMKDGGLVVLKRLSYIDTLAGFIKGDGIFYDYNRNIVKQDEISINTDSVLIYEINEDLELKDGMMVIAPLAIVNVAATIACLAAPAACFGSCPTFYSEDALSVFDSRGEGFSNAITPSFEYGDVDDLRLSAQSGTFSLIMKNEAQETHCLREVQVWAFPVKDNEEIFMTRAMDFYSSTEVFGLHKAYKNDELVTDVLATADGEEYFSSADADNIAAKEELILEFEAADIGEDLALILDFRQTLMTTYFVYSAMAYMGDEVSDIFAKIEREKDMYAKLKDGVKSELGELEVHLWNEERQVWDFQSSLYETGPIAVNRQIVPLTGPAENIKIKLAMNKGLWRIDYAAIVSLDKKLSPQKINASALKKNGGPNQYALNKLNSSSEQLISLPGDHFEFLYEMPDAQQKYKLHLYSKGYYMEWMRKEWLADKNLFKLNQMMQHPERYLKKEAQAYKEYEKIMEEVFWSSPIKSKISYDQD